MRRRTTAPRRAGGFTLLELMIVVAIVTILTTMGLWTMTRVVPAWRLRASASDVRSALAVARARAISRNATHAVLFQTGGYTTFQDADGDGALDAGETVVESRPFQAGVTYFRPTTDPLPATNAVVFTSRGIATNISVSGQSIGLASGTGETREVEVFYSGLAKRR